MFLDDRLALPRRSLLRTFAVGYAICILLGLFESAGIYGMRASAPRDSGLGFSLLLIMPSWLLFALGTPAVTGLARRFSFDRTNWIASVAVHAVASVLVTLAHLTVVTLTYLLLREPRTLAHFQGVFWVSFRYMFMFEFLVWWAVAGIYLTIHSSNMRTALAEARLTALRTQLNPHFLFNTLHAIAVLSLKGEQRAVADMLGRLSDLLRTALDGSSQEVPLATEMEFIDHYMALQRIRYADRLNVEKTIEPDTLQGLVPTMILQPIVENAIKYGISAQRGAGRVDIRAAREGTALVVEVRDTGPGFPSAGRRDGIGLGNTRARLEHLYGSNQRLECGRSPAGGAAVRIVIPFRRSAA